jgi:hypothetical protein
MHIVYSRNTFKCTESVWQLILWHLNRAEWHSGNHLVLYSGGKRSVNILGPYRRIWPFMIISPSQSIHVLSFYTMKRLLSWGVLNLAMRRKGSLQLTRILGTVSESRPVYSSSHIHSYDLIHRIGWREGCRSLPLYQRRHTSSVL